MFFILMIIVYLEHNLLYNICYNHSPGPDGYKLALVFLTWIPIRKNGDSGFLDMFSLDYPNDTTQHDTTQHKMTQHCVILCCVVSFCVEWIYIFQFFLKKKKWKKIYKTQFFSLFFFDFLKKIFERVFIKFWKNLKKCFVLFCLVLCCVMSYWYDTTHLNSLV